MKHEFQVAMVGGMLGWLMAPHTAAQSFRLLHSFSAIYNDAGWPNADGAQPNDGLVLSGDTVYGTAAAGGGSGNGTVFAVRTDATGFRTLHSFTGPWESANQDGGFPFGGLVLSGNTLYGTAQDGGISNGGTVFAINTDGRGFTNLHSFAGNSSDGASPQAGVLSSGNTLYGTTEYGGTAGNGAVFAVNTDGTGFTNLYSFTAWSDGTNSDGVHPSARLVLVGATLVGTTPQGGPSGYGTVFAVNTDGSGFTVLNGSGSGNTIATSNVVCGTTSGGGSYGNGTVFSVNTDGSALTTLHSFSGGDGANPSSLFLSGSTLYGTTVAGGGNGNGTVFAVDVDGSSFRTLYTYSSSSTNGSGVYTNADGANPIGWLLSGDTLFGTAGGGTGGTGTVFALNTNGSGFSVLHTFGGQTGQRSSDLAPINSDGMGPSGLTLTGNVLCGVAGLGGRGGSGTLFSITLPAPQLVVSQSGAAVVLAWPTNIAGFDFSGYTLQSTTNLGPAAVWVTNSVSPVVVNGQFMVTNKVSGAQQFFRLSQ